MKQKFPIQWLNSSSDNPKSKIQNRKWGWIVGTCVTLAIGRAVAEAKQSARIPRIGYRSPLDPDTDAPRSDPFRAALRELGYVEGKNIVIEWRYAENERRLASLTAELLHLKVNVIVTGGGVATRSAREATSTIPIVMTQDTDTVANGFVASALTKLLIEKSLITQAEFSQKLLEERAVYQRMLNPTAQ